MGKMEENLKILHIDTQKGWRGGQQQAIYLHSFLNREAITSLMLCQPESEMAKKCLENHLPYKTLNMRHEFDLKAVFDMIRFIDQQGFQVIHCHCAHSLALGVLVKFFRRKLVLIGARRVDFPIKKNPFSRFKYSSSLVDKIVCISENIRQVMIKCQIDESKLELIHSGVDIHKYEDLRHLEVPEELRNYYQKKKIIGTVAALVGHKDYTTLLKAARLILADREDCIFIALGDGRDKDNLLKLKSNLGLDERFIFAGYHSNVKDYLACFDLFVLASKLEGLGTSVLDAMSAGIPVVACASGGIPEMISHQVNGLLAETENPQDLAIQIHYALNHAEEMNQFAVRSKKVLTTFSIENTTQKNLDLYRKLIARDKPV